MKENDIIFKFYGAGERPDPNCFCHYGWEGLGAFAFWNYACAYYDSAEALFAKFKQSRGDFALLDSIGLTICFLYRHFVELSVKFLFAKFVAQDMNQFKEFLEKGHNLYELWQGTKPRLSSLRKRVGSTVSIGCLEHYIYEFDKFDKDEQAMRYPVKKDLSRMHDSSRLDIYNLHERMVEFYEAIGAISGDLENQLMEDVDQDKINAFVKRYEELRESVLAFYATMKKIVNVEDKEVDDYESIMASITKRDPKMEYMSKCQDDEIILFDALFYMGRMINCKELTLPKNPHEAKIDAIKMCVINMERDRLEFGKPKNDMINIWEKSCDALCHNIAKAVSVIDWDNPEVLHAVDISC